MGVSLTVASLLLMHILRGARNQQPFLCDGVRRPATHIRVGGRRTPILRKRRSPSCGLLIAIETQIVRDVAAAVLLSAVVRHSAAIRSHNALWRKTNGPATPSCYHWLPRDPGRSALLVRGVWGSFSLRTQSLIIHQWRWVTDT